MVHNTITLIGNLVRDPEVRYYTKNDGTSSAVARFTLAVSRGFKAKAGEKDTDFIDCVGFGRMAERVEKFGAKGNRVTVQGSLQNQPSYTNKEGNTVYPKDVVVVSDLTPSAFYGGKQDSQAGGSQGQSGGYANGGGFNPESPMDLPY